MPPEQALLLACPHRERRICPAWCDFVGQLCCCRRAMNLNVMCTTLRGKDSLWLCFCNPFSTGMSAGLTLEWIILYRRSSLRLISDPNDWRLFRCRLSELGNLFTRHSRADAHVYLETSPHRILPPVLQPSRAFHFVCGQTGLCGTNLPCSMSRSLAALQIEFLSARHAGRKRVAQSGLRFSFRHT